MSTKSSINIDVHLDENKVPEKIIWKSKDGTESEQSRECKAMLLSFFDEETKDTFKIDLWTKEMQTVEMDRLVFQTLRGLADTYNNATRNVKLANAMRQFVEYFGEETEIIPKNQEKA